MQVVFRAGLTVYTYNNTQLLYTALSLNKLKTLYILGLLAHMYIIRPDQFLNRSYNAETG